MLIFEIVIIFMIVIQLGLFIKNKKINNVYIKTFLWLIPAIFMIQEALFVTRWQFVIAYVVALFIFISIYFHHYHNLILKRVLIGIYTFMIVLFIASLYVFPMTDIPNPSGDYQIGTYVETVEDMSREEEYTSGFSYRKFTYQMWYPVDDAGDSEVMPWLSGGKDIARGLTKSIGLPSFILDHIQHTESNSYQIQTISDDQDSYPVVLISHGWG